MPNMGRHFVARNGSGGFLLVHMALWFHQKIERLDLGQWDDWGHAVRPVTGGTVPSNHASGTALDLNATRHPYDVPTTHTFTRVQIDAIHKRLRMYRGCIRWGGDYHSDQDAMHFEIDQPLHVCEKRARSLIDSPRGKAILAVNPGQKAVILS